jgi:hypothetical protein
MKTFSKKNSKRRSIKQKSLLLYFILSQFTKKQIGNKIAVSKRKKIEIPSTPKEKQKPLKKKIVSLNWNPMYKGSKKTNKAQQNKKIKKLNIKESCLIKIIFFFGIKKIKKKEKSEK